MAVQGIISQRRPQKKNYVAIKYSRMLFVKIYAIKTLYARIHLVFSGSHGDESEDNCLLDCCAM